MIGLGLALALIARLSGAIGGGLPQFIWIGGSRYELVTEDGQAVREDGRAIYERIS